MRCTPYGALPDLDRFLDVTQRTLHWRPDAPCWLDVAALKTGSRPGGARYRRWRRCSTTGPRIPPDTPLRGQIFQTRGELEAAEAKFDRALAVARHLGNPPQLWKTLAAIGDLRHAQGAPAAAQQAYREALTVVEAVAALLRDDALRSTLLASPHVQQLRRSAIGVTPARHHRTRQQCGGHAPA